MADLELGVPLQPDMVFRLGSITKQFTAAAILLLAEEGKLSLQDPIEKYLPGYPTQGHVITIEHLLTHTSGIQSYTDMPGWMTSRILSPTDGQGARRRLQEGADAVRAGREVGLQQLGLRPARRHHREGVGEDLRGVRRGAHLRAARHDGLALRAHRADHPEAGAGLHARGRAAEERPLPEHDAALRGGLARLDGGRPRAVGRRAVHGEAAEEGLARAGVDVPTC